MDMPVDEPGEDEATDSVDNPGSATLIERPFWANLGYLPPRITIRPFGRGLPPLPSISVPFLMTRIPSGGELMVVSKNPFATYYPRLLTLSSD